MDKKLIDKIKKLLALAESSNENEAQLAMLKAQELIVKHKLTMKDIESEEVAINVEKKITDFTYTSKTKWKCLLAMTIANNFGCYCYTNISREYDERKHDFGKINRISFIGTDEDVNVCLLVFEYALNTITTRIKEEQARMKREKLSTAGIATNFGYGFVAGLKEKFTEQLEKNSDWGLVIVKAQEVEDLYNSMAFTKGRPLSQKVSRASEAYSKGYKEGKNFSAADRIAGN